MSKLNKEELLEILDNHTYMGSLLNYRQWVEGIKQIKEMLQKPVVTEKKPDYSGAKITCRPPDRKKVGDYYPEKRKTRASKKVTEEWVERLIWTVEIDATRKEKIRRIKQMFKEVGYKMAKPVTEKWIEEKAIEIYNLLYYKSFKLEQIVDCIHSLVGEIRGKF